MADKKQVPQDEMEHKMDEAVEASIDEARENAKEAKTQTDIEGPGEIYDFADIHFHCNQCGNDNKVAEALRGISFTVPAAENAEVKLECTKCGNEMKLYFVKSSKEVADRRRAEIAAEEEANKKQDDGISQENKEDESGQGTSDDTERTTEANKKTAESPVVADAVGQDVEA